MAQFLDSGGEGCRMHAGRDNHFFILDRKIDQIPRGTVLQQSRNQRRMHGVTGSFGHHATLDAFACQSQVTDQIENFMADKFIGKTEGTILHALMCQDDRVFL
jgi:hypothetical protein